MRTIRIGTYTAKRREDLLNSFAKHSARGPYCVICGKRMKSEAQLEGMIWTTHAESEPGEVIYISDSYDHCILDNGGGGTDVAIGPECVKHVTWTHKELTEADELEIKEHNG